MLEFQTWKIKYWPGGWVRATDEDTDSTVVLHYLPVGEGDTFSLRLHTTLMTSPHPITARQWRDVPLGEIEQGFTAWQRGKLEEFALPTQLDVNQPFSLEAVLRFFEETPALEIDRQLTTGHRIPEDLQPEAAFEGLRRPADGRISDEFLRNVATVYRWLVAKGEEAPANMIGEKAGIPVRTVHRWIAQARKRRFLPPAVKGKAG